jgi:hypothetical protein
LEKGRAFCVWDLVSWGFEIVEMVEARTYISSQRPSNPTN